MEQTLHELTREMKFKYFLLNITHHTKTYEYIEFPTQHEKLFLCHIFCRNLIIDNFIPPEEKNKIINRLHFDSEEDQWKVLPLLPSEKLV